jgi:hypothetical protein
MVSFPIVNTLRQALSISARVRFRRQFVRFVNVADLVVARGVTPLLRFDGRYESSDEACASPKLISGPSEELRACEEVGITVTLPKPLTSTAKAAGRFGKQDFIYVAAEDVYRCPAGERLTYRFTSQEHGRMLRRYWTTACQSCALKAQCTTGRERRIPRWEHEAVLERVQQRLDYDPNRMTLRRQTAEHPFGTIKAWMGATHFLMRRRHKVATEMALNVLANNMKRVITILGCRPLLEAMQT